MSTIQMGDTSETRLFIDLTVSLSGPSGGFPSSHHITNTSPIPPLTLTAVLTVALLAAAERMASWMACMQHGWSGGSTYYVQHAVRNPNRIQHVVSDTPMGMPTMSSSSSIRRVGRCPPPVAPACPPHPSPQCSRAALQPRYASHAALPKVPRCAWSPGQ